MKLTAQQKSIIRNAYCRSHNLDELIKNLSDLDFCNISTAIEALFEQGYISTEDEEFIIRRKNNE